MDLILQGFIHAATLENLSYCLLGVTLGTFVGVLPGIGPLASISMLLPVTFYLDPTTALIMLAGVYYGAEYGGSITSILINLPGGTASAVTCLDGYPLARQGKAGVALFVTTIASFVGGSIGIIILTLLTPLVLAVGLAFGPAEYVSVMVLGLLAAASISSDSPLKGIGMVVMGLLLGFVGTDINSGVMRYTLNLSDLFDGVSIVTLAMGVFGVTEIIDSVLTPKGQMIAGKIRLSSMIPNRNEVRRSVFPTLRGTMIGCLAGPLPGVGPALASFVSYALEKRVARDPSRFGKGAVEGIASPEAANNAAVQTAFIPTLALGVPGSATMAVMMGALMIHGIAPGPNFIVKHPDIFWGLVASFWIGNVMLLVLNIPMIGVWVRLLQIPYRFLYPMIVMFMAIGAYSMNLSVFDIWLILAFGLFGYGMRLLGFPPAPLLIAFILGPMMEENFRRALLLGGGDFSIFILSPISGCLLALALALVVWFVLNGLRRRPPQEPDGEGALSSAE
ncbi:tripartite tricarboxylate transporter permease [Ancylobacter sp. A5.8]|uniref:tripartite tricarboxylate transporter permease n=1 Tax=Ancylobacter gelatini TaxID=2919920 RepID=UPI001F4DBAA2|nr:tripartite tricarboxylate transporter permease [Ancylobacter gelatini]MCJ8144031.1 tripartite tricarboxylate transporter permease [Ancylobacter gelatini]